MIIPKQGNLLTADAEVLVNTVNCRGVMGKGIALQFKLAFPQNYQAYVKACRRGDVKLGQMLVVPSSESTNPRYIINFPTKYHWKSASRLDDISAGLVSLVAEVRRLKVHSIAIPPLGCGNGGLDWAEVKPLIEAAFTDLSDVRVLLFEPQEPPQGKDMSVATKQPKMTNSRAAILVLLERYQNISNELSLIAVQKLVYFLQIAGEPLKLHFAKGQYGPYSEALNHVLQIMEGHYIRGYGDRSRRPSLVVVPESAQRAAALLEEMPHIRKRLESVNHLIEGFESGYGMELLATVHWVSSGDLFAANDPNEAIKKVQSWSKRKRERFKPDHICRAWQRLHDEGWLPSAN